MQLTCECGVTVCSADLDELVRRARIHARREHGIDLPADLLTRIARPDEPRPAKP